MNCSLLKEDGMEKDTTNENKATDKETTKKNIIGTEVWDSPNLSAKLV